MPFGRGRKESESRRPSRNFEQGKFVDLRDFARLRGLLGGMKVGESRSFNIRIKPSRGWKIGVIDAARWDIKDKAQAEFDVQKRGQEGNYLVTVTRLN